MDSDFRLIWKMKQGREDAMELFIRKYYDEIFRYCTCHCHDTQYGEDLTQEVLFVFLQVFRPMNTEEKRKTIFIPLPEILCVIFIAEDERCL